MSSFHRADWLSLAQAISSTLAIVGAFGVVFMQDRLHEKRQRRDYDTQAAELIYLAGSLASHGLVWVVIAREHRCDSNKVDTPEDRDNHIHELHGYIDALAALPIDKFPTGETARMVMRARSLLSDAVRFLHSVSPNAAVECGPEYGKPLVEIQNRLNLVTDNIASSIDLVPDAVQRVIKRRPDLERKKKPVKQTSVVDSSFGAK